MDRRLRRDPRSRLRFERPHDECSSSSPPERALLTVWPFRSCVTPLAGQRSRLRSMEGRRRIAGRQRLDNDHHAIWPDYMRCFAKRCLHRHFGNMVERIDHHADVECRVVKRKSLRHAFKELGLRNSSRGSPYGIHARINADRLCALGSKLPSKVACPQPMFRNLSPAIEDRTDRTTASGLSMGCICPLSFCHRF